jgi:hypothetical protein
MKIQIPRYEDGAIGLPENGRAICLTNSERRRLACSRSWWFSEVERLRLGATGPQRRGSAWHALLEDVHRWYMEHDSPYPGDGLSCVWCADDQSCEVCEDGLGPIERYRTELRDATSEDGTPLLSAEEVEEEVEKLLGMFEGWAETYGLAPSTTYEVVAVEVAIARPIRNPKTGKVYRPETFLVAEPDGSERLAATGEASGAVPLPDGASLRMARLPWYQIGRLDCVLRHRKTGVFYVGEWKSSASPQTLVKDLALDPQTDGYCWLLDAAVASGAFRTEDARGEDVVGYIYDVASTAKQSQPKKLSPQKVKALDASGEPFKIKGRWVYQTDASGEPIERSPGFSKAASTVPSWRWRRAIAEEGFAESDYAEQIDEALRKVDPRLYVREWGVSSEEARLRYGEEIYSVAVRISGLRRAAARAKTVEDLNVAFPRTPICRMPGGFCSYRSPCLLDGEEARQSFEVAPSVVWNP